MQKTGRGGGGSIGDFCAISMLKTLVKECLLGQVKKCLRKPFNDFSDPTEPMKPLSKILTCTLMLTLIVSTIALARIANAQTFTPVEPQFTVRYVGISYSEPTTYTTDPYTGKQIAHPGEYFENRSIIVSIKNQPFTPYTDESGNLTQVYYNVMWKPHYDVYWHAFSNNSRNIVYPQSNGEYTEVTILHNGDIRSEGQIDVKLQVLVGYMIYHWYTKSDGEFSMGMSMQGYYDHYVFFGKEEYNGTIMQTYDLADGNVTYATIPADPTPSETPTETPTPNSTLYTNPDNSTQQTGNPPTDNQVGNNAADAFSLGNFKLGIGEVAFLAVVFAVIGSIVTLGLTRKRQKKID